MTWPLEWAPIPEGIEPLSPLGAHKNRAARLRALGNLNPPIIPEIIGRAIIAAQSCYMAGEDR